MYLPQHFEETRVEELHRVIAEFPLGALVLNGPNGLDANHLPFELEAESGAHGRLLAHVARANPLWQEAKDGDEALVIFRSVDAYVSPNWYPSKHESHRQVPTWNYKAIVGIEIEITRLIGKWKLSQNREERDRLGVADELRKRGDGAMSNAMTQDR